MVVIDGIRTGAINDVHQYFGPLAVAQELVTKASACVSALQQPCIVPILVELSRKRQCLMQIHKAIAALLLPNIESVLVNCVILNVSHVLADLMGLA